MNVRRETAEVFVSPDGRRFFTARAAYRKAAWFHLKQEHGECECEPEDEGGRYPGYSCCLHNGTLDNERALIERRLRAEDKEAGHAN